MAHDPWQWAGASFKAMPCESTFSVLSRIGAHGVLSPRVLKEKTSRSAQVKSHGDSFLDLSWLDERKLREGYGLEYAQLPDVKRFEQFGSLLAVYFSNRLQICPLCFEAGYHSYWHQMRNLQACPIHFVPIQTVCQCSNPFPSYRFSKDLFKFPYRCIHCQSPLAGAMVDYDQYEDFRDKHETVSRSFDAIESWAQSTPPKLDAARITGHLPGMRNWCRPDDFLRSLGEQFHPFPNGATASTPSAITVLTWRVEMMSSRWLGGHEELYRRKRKRRQTVLLYRTTLRMLASWIESDGIHVEGGLYPFKEGHLLRVADLPTKVIAYRLVRAQLEGYGCNEDGYTRPILKHNYPEIFLPSFEGRVPRLAWRAIFLAMFACCYYLVEAGKREGYINMNTLGIKAEDMICRFFPSSPVGICKGGVAFPSIPGLPIKPASLLTNKLRLEEQSDVRTSEDLIRAVGRYYY